MYITSETSAAKDTLVKESKAALKAFTYSMFDTTPSGMNHWHLTMSLHLEVLLIVLLVINSVRIVLVISSLLYFL